MSQVNVSGDGNLIAGNIKKDVTIFGVTGTLSGGGGDVNGILPMPVTNLDVTQKESSRGQANVTFNIPLDCDDVVLLLKEDTYPAGLEDYDQKITIEDAVSGSKNVITLTPAEDGSYAYTYGIWALSKKDDVGTQTAIHATNRVLFNPLYASGAYNSLEITASNSQSWGSSNVYLARSSNLCFLGTPNGLFVVDIENGTGKQLNTDNISEKPTIIVVDNNKYIITYGSNTYEFIVGTQTATKLTSITNSYSGEYGDYLFFGSNQIYKKLTGEILTTVTNSGGTVIISYTNGAFSYRNGSNNSCVKKFDFSNDSWINIGTYDLNGVETVLPRKQL